MSNNTTETSGSNLLVNDTVELVGFVGCVLLVIIAIFAYKRWCDHSPIDRYKPMGDQPSCLKQLFDYGCRFFPTHRVPETQNPSMTVMSSL